MKGSEIDDPGHLIGLKPRRFPIGELANSQSRFVHYAGRIRKQQVCLGHAGSNIP